MVKDNFETETAAFWYKAPEVQDGSVTPEDIQTEVFFFPSAQVAEMDGTFTNTQRLIKCHDKAVDPPGDCRSDIWFTYHLGQRLKKLYEGSTEPRDQGFLNLVWDFDPDAGRGRGLADQGRAERARRSCARSTATCPASRTSTCPASPP